MREKISENARLLHMLDAIRLIQEFTDGLTYEHYMEDIKLRLALVKLLEIIGEAANPVTKDTQNKFTEVEWNTLYVVRNILFHEYFGINYDIIWQAITDKIPALKIKVEMFYSNYLLTKSNPPLCLPKHSNKRISSSTSTALLPKSKRWMY